MERSRERERIGRRVLQLAGALSRSRGRLERLQTLPTAAPALENTSSAQNILSRLAEFRGAAAIAQGRLAQIDASLAAVQADMTRLVEETGGLSDLRIAR